jgi:hypothetical protein
MLSANTYLSKPRKSLRNYDKECAFILACHAGDIEVVKYLLETNPNLDIHAKDDQGFIYAVEFCNIELIKFLLHNGANIFAQDGKVLQDDFLFQDQDSVSDIRKTKRFLDSWVVYKSSVFILEDCLQRVKKASNMFDILSFSDSSPVDKERIITIYLSNDVDLSYQDDFIKYKKQLAEYVENLKSCITLYMIPDACRLVVSYL